MTTTHTKKSITIKVDETLKNDADDILDQMGLNMTTLPNMTLKRVVADRQLPFLPTAQSSLNKAIDELNNGNYKTFNTIHDLMDDLNDED